MGNNFCCYAGTQQVPEKRKVPQQDDLVMMKIQKNSIFPRSNKYLFIPHVNNSYYTKYLDQLQDIQNDTCITDLGFKEIFFQNKLDICKRKYETYSLRLQQLEGCYLKKRQSSWKEKQQENKALILEENSPFFGKEEEEILASCQPYVKLVIEIESAEDLKHSDCCLTKSNPYVTVQQLTTMFPFDLVNTDPQIQDCIDNNEYIINEGFMEYQTALSTESKDPVWKDCFQLYFDKEKVKFNPFEAIVKIQCHNKIRQKNHQFVGEEKIFYLESDFLEGQIQEKQIVLHSREDQDELNGIIQIKVQKISNEISLVKQSLRQMKDKYKICKSISENLKTRMKLESSNMNDVEEYFNDNNNSVGARHWQSQQISDM